MFGHMLDGVLWVPVDGEGPDFWDETFGPDDPRDSRREPRRYSVSRLSRRKGLFRDWEDFLARTSEADRMRWCAKKAKVANRSRLMSGSPKDRVTPEDVWEVLKRAEGRCRYCGSLAVERRPSDPVTGAPLPWERVGRRIGSLEHVDARVDGGANVVGNLAWTCLWCNTWKCERTKGALDHGGCYPAKKRCAPSPLATPARPVRRDRG